jgi:competence protein ComFC
MKLWQHLLQLLFPDFCLNCQRLGPLLCEHCHHGIEFYFKQPALNNLERVYLDELQIMAKFQPPLSILIKALKYKHARNVAPMLAQLLYQHCQIAKADYLNFVPIHKMRLRQRYYNQCQEIAKELSLLTSIPVIEALSRQRNQKAQAKISNQALRLTRLQNTFVIRDDKTRALVEGKKLILIDDVLTTGTTLNENAKILKQAGAAWVGGLIIASKKS